MQFYSYKVCVFLNANSGYIDPKNIKEKHI